MKRQHLKIGGLIGLAMALGCATDAAAQNTTVANPFLWADIPDPSIVRVGDDFYMSHTTMHFAPGVPIMKSSDLANWRVVGYAYQTLINNDQMNLNGGKNAYGKGSWASSIRYKDGTFYVLVPSYTSNKTHLYSTKDVEKGPWKEVQFPFYHDPSLHLDESGRNFVVYGGTDIKIIELNSTLTGTQNGGVNKTIISSSALKALIGSNPILVGEGSHIEKINGWYYVFIICWPNGGGFDGRTELAFRSKTIDGNYEGKVVHSSKGVAQGSVVQDKDGKWWGYLFQDNGAVGRSPWIMPVTWANDWPSFNGGTSPTTFTIPTNTPVKIQHVTSDDFDTPTMKLEWQWNHNPDNARWSLSAKPGSYRITTGRVDGQVVDAKNTLTQRSFGPKSSGRTVVDVTNMKDGDIAGLVALQEVYGFVGVKKNGSTKSVIMVNANSQVASAEVTQDRVFLRVDMDFTNRTDKATFWYSTDSTSWKQIGNTLSMKYNLTHFTGYRFGLFAYSTKSAGGSADFDWFKIGANANDEIVVPPLAPVGVAPAPDRLHGTSFVGARIRDGVLSFGYKAPRAGHVRIQLMDATGRVVSDLVDAGVEAGEHLVDRPLSGLRAGRYLLVARLDGALMESVVLPKLD